MKRKRDNAVSEAPGGRRAGVPAPASAAAALLAKRLIPYAAILLVALLVYIPSFTCGFVWDDDQHLTQNVLLRSWSGLKTLWLNPTALHVYYPLTFTTFALEYSLWGLHPAGYHAVNALLHAINAVLLGVLLRRLKIPGAWYSAAAFALHPVCVMSVAWVCELKNVQSFAFYLLSLLAYLGFDESRQPGPQAGPTRGATSWRSYGCALALFLCAMLSKTVTCTLPVTLLLLLAWRRGLRRRDALEVLPFFAVAVAIGLVTVHVETAAAGARGADWDFSLVERALNAGRMFWNYVYRLAWPVGLTFLYPKWHADAGNAWHYAFPVAAAAVPLTLWSLRRKLGAGPAVAVTAYGLTLAPVLGFLNVFMMRYTFVADHWQYHACGALIALSGAAAWRNTAGGPSGLPRGRPIRTATAALVLAVLAGLTLRQQRIYRNEETLWRDTLARTPGSDMAHYNLANILYRGNRLDEALQHYTRSLAIEPGSSDARCNLGMTLLKMGRREEAAAQFMQVLETAPEFEDAHTDLGCLYAMQGMPEKALPHFESVVRMNPGWALGNKNLAACLADLGRPDEALRYYREARRLDPGNADTCLGMARLLEDAGQTGAAAELYRAALRLRPDWALPATRLAWILATAADARLRSPAEAMWLSERLLEGPAGDDPGVLDVAAAAAAAAGRFADAVNLAARSVSAALPPQSGEQKKERLARLELYRLGRPFISSPRTAGDPEKREPAAAP